MSEIQVGEKIRQLRESKQISVEELAEKVSSVLNWLKD